MIAIFHDSDAEYTAWLLDHPGNYVVNTRNTYSPSYMVLHRGSCATVNPSASNSEPGAFTERDYIKLCSTDLGALERLVSALGRENGSFSGECSKCAPRDEQV